MNVKIKPEIKSVKVFDAFAGTIKRIVSDSLNKISVWLKASQQYRVDRAAIRSLLDLSEKDLSDIGISRADIIWASKLPRDKVATLELQKRAKAERY